jgi:hypothetical protein
MCDYRYVGVQLKSKVEEKSMNFQRSICLGSLLLLLFSLSIASAAQRGRDDQRRRDEGRWELLGRATVNGRQDHDRVFVSNRGAFRQIQLGIRGGDIEFQRVVVHFDNGEDHQLDIRDRISDRGKTRVIDLPGDRRRIRSVEFWCSKQTWRSRPVVNIWGQR